MLTDEELFINSLKNPNLFAEVVKRYEKRFLTKATRMTGSADDAADIVQDTFVKIYIQGKRFEPAGEGSFRAWAYTVLIRTSLSYLRKLKRERLVNIHLDGDIAERLADDRAFSFDRYALSDWVLNKLSTVSSAAQKVLTLHFLEGLTTQEIAMEEGVSEGTIRTRLSRAKKELKYELSND
jgi:RNA polymerase sigma-70 factor (ECF subfamily)